MTLEQYLAERRVKPSVFAAEIGVAASTIARILRGERSPGLDLLTLIRDKTGGAVTPNDFIPPLTAERFDETASGPRRNLDFGGDAVGTATSGPAE